MEAQKTVEIEKGSMAIMLHYSDVVLKITTASLMNPNGACIVEDLAYTPDTMRAYNIPYSANMMRQALETLPASVRISLYHLENLRDHMFGLENNHGDLTDATLRRHVLDVVQSYPEKMRPVVRESLAALEDLDVCAETFAECVTMATRIAETWYDEHS